MLRVSPLVRIRYDTGTGESLRRSLRGLSPNDALSPLMIHFPVIWVRTPSTVGA
jgi:hypothetical protein